MLSGNTTFITVDFENVQPKNLWQLRGGSFLMKAEEDGDEKDEGEAAGEVGEDKSFVGVENFAEHGVDGEE
jgi:hypothetical protein